MRALLVALSTAAGAGVVGATARYYWHRHLSFRDERRAEEARRRDHA